MRATSILGALLLFTEVLPAAAPAKIDFQRDVRPILSDNCFHCHGPDKDSRMVDLRLDRREDATASRPSGTPVVPGKPDESLVWKRITHKSPALRMPPLASHKTLTDEQKEILRLWIEQGAPWKEHWAYTNPQRPPLPETKNAAWSANPIDRFILARLEAAGLQPAPEAPRHVLIRRAALDTTGLPPTPEQTAAFLNDDRPGAYERMLDRFFASPHYGEHRARYWLDAARYADTHGIHIDNYREMWPYRDWVINAFNRNMPFDRFTIEQLAGDLLPNRTLEQQTATGFHRCNATTNEAGAIEEEFAAIYAKDRVDTTSAVWLGLTLGCATCHDHKFDPLTQRDFYSMTAFFRNTVQPTMDGNIPDTPPIIGIPEGADKQRWESLDRAYNHLLENVRRMEQAPDPSFEAWLRSPARHSIQDPLPAVQSLLTLQPGSPAVVRYGAVEKSFPLSKGVTVAESPVAGIKALHFDKESRLDLYNLRAIQTNTPFSVSVWFYFPKEESSYTIVSQTVPADKGRGWVIDSSGRVPGMRITADGGKSISIRGGFLTQLKHGSWNHLVFTYDGSGEQPGLAMYMNGELAQVGGRGESRLKLEGPMNVGQALRLGNEAKRYLGDGAIADLRIFNRVVSPEEARALASWPILYTARSRDVRALTPQERVILRNYYLVNHSRPFQSAIAQRLSLESQRSAILRRSPLTHVMQERADQQPYAHVLNRGMYDQPKDRVEPATPAVLPPMKKDQPRNRLGLALWLVDASNPLTARVAVNRFWQEIFGAGLVRTSDDFGSQGEVPSHPELLDWLAVEFRESGWDVKKLLKLMLTSASYRQAAITTPEKLKADPENRLLSRGPRFRMDAEVVRDYALAASGLLTPTIGGPSVKPYQPSGVWEAVAMDSSNTRFYSRDSADSLYRRSLYWFWKRSAPPASMDIFNAPTRELCTVRRERTNTPLQALVTMNDIQFVEAARNLAQQALRAGGPELDRRLTVIAQQVLSRPFTAAEMDVLRRSYRDYLNYYDSKPADARKLISFGESAPDASLNVAEFAAMTVIANQVFNLDETLNK